METSLNTPMMKQYLGIKEKYQDCLLLYRMGDFYELFLDDALIGAKVLGITLTSRSKGRDGRIPMAGVPYHAIDTYLSKLVKAGYKVAICEQLSEPNSKGLVQRDVVRVVTPGTVLDEKALEQKENNYIVSVACKENTIAIALCDLSTGEFLVDQQEHADPFIPLHEYIEHYHPVECLVSSQLYEDKEMMRELRQHTHIHITRVPTWQTQARGARNTLTAHFGLHTLESFEIHSLLLAQETAAVLLTYVSDTQKGKISHIQKITRIRQESQLILDRATQINLELFSTIREHDSRGSLLHVIDKTHTAMGGRLLKHWMLEPLCDHDAICQRQESVEQLLESTKTLQKIQGYLDCIHDIERMLSRLSVGIGNARDLINLSHALDASIAVIELIRSLRSTELDQICLNTLDTGEIATVRTLITETILPEPKITLKEGGIIQRGIDPHLDELHQLLDRGTDWLHTFEKDERERTEISSLKVRFNSVFGYYIEISKANIHLAPSNYTRKQTLVNGERFITAELKEHEEKVLTAQEEICRIEYEMYQQTLQQVLSHTNLIQQVAQTIATIDCLCSFAQVAQSYDYVRPKMLFSNEIKITDGRHPVVERLFVDTPFVPNSVKLDPLKEQLLIITGPNMAGKSVFARQVALIVLLAHMGSFVPVKSAHIGIVDRIFVRSGASDVITSGLSTFMVEMVETAAILNSATEKSLIVMDEIGRGTSTYDGISIAWAIATYLAGKDRIHAKTLFATHYHELSELEELYPKRIKNFHMHVIEQKDGPHFVHTLVEGRSTSSFGIAVAKRAGIPQEVIDIATKKLITLEKSREVTFEPKKSLKVETHGDKLVHEIQSLNLSHMTPLEALNTLAHLQKKTR